MAQSLLSINPELKQYLKVYRLPDIYEALLSGVVIVCPDDPVPFLIESLEFIKKNGYLSLEWDMFIPKEMRPKRKVVSETNLNAIFNLDADMQPTTEMIAQAYTHYHMSLKRFGFSLWMVYHLRKQQKAMEQRDREQKAVVHYEHRKMRKALHVWIEWIKYRKGRQSMAFNRIQHVYQVSMGRVIFEAWHNVTLDAKKTREYFERLERGENMADDDLFGKGDGDARDDISCLPRHLAVKIFGYLQINDLARCNCVCRAWKVIVQSSQLWSRLDLSKVKDKLKNGITDNVATKMLYRVRPYLIHLNVKQCHKLGRSTFLALRECRNIQDLNLSQCPGLNDETLRIVTEGCRILLYLNVSHTSITDSSLRTLARNSTNLSFLSLAFCLNFTDRGLAYLGSGKGARKILYMDLSGCMQVTPDGFNSFSRGMPDLHSLVLNEFTTLTDECITSVIQHCQQLEYVSLLGSPNITDESFRCLAQCTKIRTLKLDCNERMTDVAMKHVGKACLELQHLFMTDCQRVSDASLKSLTACRHLTVLNLADCVRISDTGVRYIVESPCGPKLRELNLTNCIRVGDMALVNIHKRCHSLTYLSVCFCEHISEAGIELLGNLHSLISLNVSGCNAGDQALSALGNNPGFRDVCVAECVNVTDLGLSKFAQQCRQIERLDLSHCSQLTDGAIKNLAFCCRMLTHLNLAGCRLLTDLSIQYLSGVCHYLISMDLSGCVLLSDKCLKYLRKGCSKMTFLTLLYCKGIAKTTAIKMGRHIPVVQWSDDDVPGYYGY